MNQMKIEESIAKLKRFKYHAIGRLELEDAIDGVVSWYEQMMKGAVEGEAHPDDCEIWVNLSGYGFNIKDGDKVRFIVLPKED